MREEKIPYITEKFKQHTPTSSAEDRWATGDEFLPDLVAALTLTSDPNSSPYNAPQNPDLLDIAPTWPRDKVCIDLRRYTAQLVMVKMRFEQ